VALWLLSMTTLPITLRLYEIVFCSYYILHDTTTTTTYNQHVKGE
jgi:hypothetical protein